MTVAIAFDDIVLHYGKRAVLDHFSLSVSDGQILGLLGPSGSGKSTVLRLALGLVAPDKGSVRIFDEVVSRDGKVVVPPERRRIAVVFQDLALWPHLTVRGNLAFALTSQKVPRDVQEQRIRATLDRLGLSGKENSHPGQLSGGERQRVAIARALVLEPRAVLLDEPLANLDVVLKRELLAAFHELLKERHATAIYVTHDLREAAALGDRIAVVEQGRITYQGSFGDLRLRPTTPFIENVVEDLAWVEAFSG